MARAILAAGLHNVLPEPLKNLLALHSLVFWVVLRSDADLKWLRHFEDDRDFMRTIRGVRAASEMGAEARQRLPGTPHRDPRLSELPNEIPPEDSVQAAREELMKALDDPGIRRVMETVVGEDALDETLEQALERANQVIDTLAKYGPRRGLRNLLGLSASGLPDTVRLSRAAKASVFHSELAEYLEVHLGITDGPWCQKVLIAVNQEDCPGRWLVDTLDNEATLAEPKQSGSNVMDHWHASFFPYVDLFFGDRRTVTYLRQVQKRANTPSTIKACPVPATAPASIAGFADALEDRLEYAV